jgi:hypothetical protein
MAGYPTRKGLDPLRATASAQASERAFLRSPGRQSWTVAGYLGNSLECLPCVTFY